MEVNDSWIIKNPLQSSGTSSYDCTAGKRNNAKNYLSVKNAYDLL